MKSMQFDIQWGALGTKSQGALAITWLRKFFRLFDVKQLGRITVKGRKSGDIFSKYFPPTGRVDFYRLHCAICKKFPFEVKVSRRPLYKKDDGSFPSAPRGYIVAGTKSSPDGKKTWKKVYSYVKIENLEEALVWGISREAFFWLVKTKQIGGRSNPIDAAEFADHVLEGYKSLMDPVTIKENWDETHRAFRLQDKPPDKFHLLIVGGKPRNVPLKHIKCKVTQIDSDTTDSSSKKYTSYFSVSPDIVLMFKDFISHDAFWGFKNAAKNLEIPFVATKGGFGALIAQAKARGYDLSKYLETTDKPSKLIEIEKPEQEKSMSKEESLTKWINTISKRGKERVAKEGKRIYIVKNAKEGYSLVFKGAILEDALKLVKKRKYGSGTRGMLTVKEAEDVIAVLDHSYGFSKQGITIEPKTAIRNIGYVQGTLPPSVAKRMSGEIKRKPKKKVEEKKAEKSSGAKKPSSKIKERQAAGELPKTPEYAVENDHTDLPKLQVEGKAIDVFLAELGLHLRKMDESREYEREQHKKIQVLTMENSAFIEQITQLEAKVEELEEEVKAWKQMATKKKK